MKKTWKTRKTKKTILNKRKRRNPAVAFSLLKPKEMEATVELLAFGSLGCEILRALGIKPIDLLTGCLPKAEPEAEGPIQ